MVFPTKVPSTYVARCLEFTLKRQVADEEVNDTLPDTRALASVAKLKTRFFKKGDKAGFERFKEDYLKDIADEYWEMAIAEDPKVARYCRRFMKEKPTLPRSRGGGTTTTNKRKRSRSPSPARSPAPKSKKRRIRFVNVFHPINDDSEYPDQAVFTFKGNAGVGGNPNFPMPLCKGIRRACRNYGKGNRYAPIPKDNSEGNNYFFEVAYNSDASNGGGSASGSDSEDNNLD